jgi:hypothetical protein
MFRLDSDSSGSVSLEEFVSLSNELGKFFVQKTLWRNESPKDAYAKSNQSWDIKKDR